MGTINPNKYVLLKLIEFFIQLTENEWSYTWFQQNLVTAHTTDDSLTE
jgi:hypothetical protein